MGCSDARVWHGGIRTAILSGSKLERYVAGGAITSGRMIAAWPFKHQPADHLQRPAEEARIRKLALDSGKSRRQSLGAS